MGGLLYPDRASLFRYDGFVNPLPSRTWSGSLCRGSLGILPDSHGSNKNQEALAENHCPLRKLSGFLVPSG